MAPFADATKHNVFRWDIQAGVHQDLEMEPDAQVPAHVRQAPWPRREQQQPQPQLQLRRHDVVPPDVPPQLRRYDVVPPDVLPQPVYYHQRCRDYLLGINPVLDVGVHSAIGVRLGYRMVMGKSGSRRRKVAKTAAVVGGILVVKAIF